MPFKKGILCNFANDEPGVLHDHTRALVSHLTERAVSRHILGFFFRFTTSRFRDIVKV